MGDSDRTGNVSTLKNYANNLGISLDIDVLKYPHHGNANLSIEFLNVTTSKYVIVPNLGHSSHPITENRNRISNVGAKLYELKKHGNVVVLSNGKSIQIEINQQASSYKK